MYQQMLGAALQVWRKPPPLRPSSSPRPRPIPTAPDPPALTHRPPSAKPPHTLLTPPHSSKPQATTAYADEYEVVDSSYEMEEQMLLFANPTMANF